MISGDSHNFKSTYFFIRPAYLSVSVFVHVYVILHISQEHQLHESNILEVGFTRLQSFCLTLVSISFVIS